MGCVNSAELLKGCFQRSTLREPWSYDSDESEKEQNDDVRNVALSGCQPLSALGSTSWASQDRLLKVFHPSGKGTCGRGRLVALNHYRTYRTWSSNTIDTVI